MNLVIGAAVVLTAGIAFASQDRIIRTIDTGQTVVVKGNLLPQRSHWIVGGTGVV